jgi:hypothetical protein
VIICVFSKSGTVSQGRVHATELKKSLHIQERITTERPSSMCLDIVGMFPKSKCLSLLPKVEYFLVRRTLKTWNTWYCPLDKHHGVREGWW